MREMHLTRAIDRSATPPTADSVDLVKPSPQGLYRVRHRCAENFCDQRVVKDGRCEAHQHLVVKKKSGVRSEKGMSYQHLYKGSTWHVLRGYCLAKQPLCVKCLSIDITTVATVADHVVPHKGDLILFRDSNNLRSLCMSCHDAKTKFELTSKEPWRFYEDTPEPFI